MSRPIVAPSFRVGVAAVLVLFATACEHDHAPAEPLPSRVSVLSGNGQQTLDGSRVSEPLAVRVTGPGGVSAPGVEVLWSVEPGLGEFHSFPDDQTLASGISVTDASGVARMYFVPEIVGETLIRASATSVSPTPAQFTVVDRPQFEILFGPLFDCTPSIDTSRFVLDKSVNLTATVNATVSLVYSKGLDGSCAARIKTTMVPDGGEPFDTGTMFSGNNFVFKPRVAGTWEFTDVVNGGSARLIVH